MFRPIPAHFHNVNGDLTKKILKFLQEKIWAIILWNRVEIFLLKGSHFSVVLKAMPHGSDFYDEFDKMHQIYEKSYCAMGILTKSL